MRAPTLAPFVDAVMAARVECFSAARAARTLLRAYRAFSMALYADRAVFVFKSVQWASIPKRTSSVHNSNNIYLVL